MLLCFGADTKEPISLEKKTYENTTEKLVLCLTNSLCNLQKKLYNSEADIQSVQKTTLYAATKVNLLFLK